MNKGNFIISTSVAAGIVIAAIGGWVAQNRVLEARVEGVATELRGVNSVQDKQIAAMVEAVETIKDVQKEQGRDIKAILQAVK